MTTLARILVAVALGAAAGPLSAQSLRTLAGNRQFARQERLNVLVEFAAGHLAIGRDETGMLYRAKVVYDEEKFEPVLDYSSRDGSLHVGVDGIKGRHGDHDSKQQLKLDVSPRVPVRFEIKFGAAEADLDLGGLNLERAEISTGATDTRVRFSTPTTGRCEELTIHVGAAAFRAEQLANARCERVELMGGVGDLTLDFTGDWGSITRAAADISVGMGSLTLRLPQSVGVQIDMARLFTNFDRPGLIKRGSAWYSANYDSATTRLHLNVKSAMGSVDVQWVNP